MLSFQSNLCTSDKMQTIYISVRKKSKVLWFKLS
jgi:hypothetical protein